MKDFDAWNEIKKKVDKTDINFFYKQQEIWWCRNGINVGIESNGKGDDFARPVLVIKKHNAHSCLVISLTNQNKDNPAYCEIDQENFPGTYANLSQIRTIDSKRLISKIGFLSKDSFDKVRKLIRDFNGL